MNNKLLTNWPTYKKLVHSGKGMEGKKGREGNLVRRKREDRKINKGRKTRKTEKKRIHTAKKKINFLRMA